MLQMGMWVSVCMVASQRRQYFRAGSVPLHERLTGGSAAGLCDLGYLPNPPELQGVCVRECVF